MRRGARIALVNVEEDVDAAILLDAALEHAGRAALDELVVDDAVGGRPALHSELRSRPWGEPRSPRILILGGPKMEP